jgi:hypothetical protein
MNTYRVYILNNGSGRSRSQWPRGLRHELFARSNVRIVGSNTTQGIDVCMCVYSVFVLPSVQVAALRRADHLSKESYRLCKKLQNWRWGQGPTKECRAIGDWVKWWDVYSETLSSLCNCRCQTESYLSNSIFSFAWNSDAHIDEMECHDCVVCSERDLHCSNRNLQLFNELLSLHLSW